MSVAHLLTSCTQFGIILGQNIFYQVGRKLGLGILGKKRKRTDGHTVSARQEMALTSSARVQVFVLTAYLVSFYFYFFHSIYTCVSSHVL